MRLDPDMVRAAISGRRTKPEAGSRHPVRLSAHLDSGLSHWQWLVKWLLAIPYLIVLAFLWPAIILAPTAGV